MQKWCQFPPLQVVWGGEAVWSFGRLQLPLLAPRPQISGKESSYNCFDTHAYTRDRRITTLRIYKFTIKLTTVHTVERRP